MARWALAAVAVLLVAGCVEYPRWTPDVDHGAPAEAGDGPRTVTVRVSDGTASVPASVILMWTKEKGALEDGQDPVQLLLLGLRSASGTVVGHVPADREVMVVAGSWSDLTEEWLAPIPAGTEPVTVDARLYPRDHSFRFEGSWGPAAAGFDLWPYADYVAWQPTDLTLSDDAAENREMQRRVRYVDAALRWENTPTAMGDLGLILAGGDGSVCEMQDERRDLTLGPQEQAFVFPYYSRCSFFLPNYVYEVLPPVQVGPGTRSHMVAPLGLPYTIEASVTLAESHGWQALVKRLDDRKVEREWVDAVPPAAPSSPSSAAPSASGGRTTEPVPRGVEAEAAPAGFALAFAGLGVALVARRRR
jgi:hypothetical protein